MKKSILLITLIVVAIIAWYSYTQYNRKNVDITTKKTEHNIDALSLIAAFEKDTASSSKKYIDKIVEVTGTIKKIEAEEAPAVLFLGDSNQMSAIVCSMDSVYATTYSSLKKGTKITIKGICNGYQYDELLGTDVKLNRCVIAD